MLVGIMSRGKVSIQCDNKNRSSGYPSASHLLNTGLSFCLERTPLEYPKWIWRALFNDCFLGLRLMLIFRSIVEIEVTVCFWPVVFSQPFFVRICAINWVLFVTVIDLSLFTFSRKFCTVYHISSWKWGNWNFGFTPKNSSILQTSNWSLKLYLCKKFPPRTTESWLVATAWGQPPGKRIVSPAQSWKTSLSH